MFLLAILAAAAFAGDMLQPGAPRLDRPTPTALGIQLPISGDDNRNAAVSVRYRAAGDEAWTEALPLFRVRPEHVVRWTVEPQFAGSIFDLRPATGYEIELHITDPDGVDETVALSAATRALPANPADPRTVEVKDAVELRAALAAARPGDLIALAEGVYGGAFSIAASGTEQDPIVIRGAGVDSTVLDGGGCDCNVLEVYGRGFIHLERLTIRNGLRAIRFQTPGAEANAVRRVAIRDVRAGISARPNQRDFYICDNVLEGRLRWPLVYTDDGGAHSNDDGIQVQGSGHVVCHNRISGFGDAMKVEQDGARAVDFYGNDVLWSYDNGLELDGGEGNLRALRNRFTNVFATLSVQPVYGGPAYLLRNEVVNTVHEQMKFHALGGNPPRDPSGVLVYHNTFVSPGLALNLQTSATSHHFVIENNLFVGPEKPGPRIVDWSGRVDDGRWDYNGYFPDGPISFNLPPPRGYTTFPNLAALQEFGWERNGLTLAAPIFANGFAATADYRTLLEPRDTALDPASGAIDRGRRLPNVNDDYTGAAPDMGARESGCAAPAYGPRPEGVDESSTTPACGSAQAARRPGAR